MFGNTFKKFIPGFSIYSLVLLVAGFIFYAYLPGININRWYWAILLFLYFVTAASFLVLSNSIEKKISRFANVFMLLNFSRLIIFTAIIFVFAYTHKEQAASFTITFFVYYLLITIWEVASLRKTNK
jgi:hypothetical protein